MLASSAVWRTLPIVCVLLACSPAGNASAPNVHSGGAGSSATAGNATGGAGASATGGASGTATAEGGSEPSTSGASGGVAAAGGTAAGGTSATAGTNTGGAASSCGINSILCTDFEAATIPAQLVFYPEYLRPTQTSVTLDTTVFHGGARALKVTGSDYSQMLGIAVPSKFWGRVYLRSDTDIQEGHDTYVTVGTGSGDPNDGTYIRVGEHECQLELNRNTDDKELLSNGGQYMCQGGVKLLKDTWYCLEFYFDGPGQETRIFVDGTEVPALHTTDWGTYDYKIFKLGYEKYGGQAKTLWYDDLALATEQLHCL